MKVRAGREYLVHSEDVEMVYKGLLHLIDSLEQYRTWCSSMDKSHPEYHGDARKNIDADLIIYRRLQLDIWEKSLARVVDTVQYNEERLSK